MSERKKRKRLSGLRRANMIMGRGAKCAHCGTRAGLTLHHKQRCSRGGSNHGNNLIVLCRDCHDVYHFETEPRLEAMLAAQRARPLLRETKANARPHAPQSRSTTINGDTTP